MDEKAVEKIRASCTRFLTGHYPIKPKTFFSDLAEYVSDDVNSDRYGTGEVITNFEKTIASLLGTESAIFMPSGTMAQQIALRIWTDQRGINRVAFHPTCHLELHEQHGYQYLHNLRPVLVGSPYSLMTYKDIAATVQPLGALLLELPQREIGGQLPTWDELTKIITWAKEHTIPVHLDGARLWECRSYYNREYARICDLFDSVYVSFYKGIGGLTGSILAGSNDFIAQARIWQRRHGGNLFRLFPYVLSAQKGIEERLPKMSHYYSKTLEIAEALSTIDGIKILPNPPHINMMHIFLQGEKEKLVQSALHLSEETRIWLFGDLMPSQLPQYYKLEFYVGDATMDIETEEIRNMFVRILEYSNALAL